MGRETLNPDVIELGDAIKDFRREHTDALNSIRARLEAVETRAARPPATAMGASARSVATDAFLRCCRTGVRDGLATSA